MGNSKLFVVETYQPNQTDASIIVKGEITQEELTTLNSAFEICSLYLSITQIKDIVVENGHIFKKYMSAENLKELSAQNVSPNRAILLANKAVLNYASSIKTYIDMETRILKNKASEKALGEFTKICHTFYDKHLEYRFWANFRNYIVHYEFPYSIYKEHIDEGCKIICTKEHLLQFDNWKHSKADIEKMGDEIDLPSLVDNMSSLIYALYLDFFRHFASIIIDGINAYGEFCRRYDVKLPAILKMKDDTQIKGSHLQPLPIEYLKASFEILKNHPHIQINIE